MEKRYVNDTVYEVIKLLGKGKSGYAYLVKDDHKFYVLKQIHHEPCDYYQFGDKLQAEQDAYRKLSQIGIRMPKLFAIDKERECLLKEYIEGKTIFELVKANQMKNSYFDQIQTMCKLLYAANTNIDYFPTNFIVQNELLYYVDYECNEYMSKWNFENWGYKYWQQTEEFRAYVDKHNELKE